MMILIVPLQMMEATITKIKNTADQTVIIIPNTFTNLDGTYPIVGFRDFCKLGN